MFCGHYSGQLLFILWSQQLLLLVTSLKALNEMLLRDFFLFVYCVIAINLCKLIVCVVFSVQVCECIDSVISISNSMLRVAAKKPIFTSLIKRFAFDSNSIMYVLKSFMNFVAISLKTNYTISWSNSNQLHYYSFILSPLLFVQFENIRNVMTISLSKILLTSVKHLYHHPFASTESTLHTMNCGHCVMASGSQLYKSLSLNYINKCVSWKEDFVKFK